ncbi:hypothetical protein Ddye_024581 [Dipteronia dyeriana]|uniref:Prefoldin subunit 6 n=1 Tax=Dipteronia dyeriana TaxID=168575 RepID=A0AAD9TW45_9ROSI|nr:hypothetical protein Ddye_024581 [Dipteronia dyeriana]
MSQTNERLKWMFGKKSIEVFDLLKTNPRIIQTSLSHSLCIPLSSIFIAQTDHPVNCGARGRWSLASSSSSVDLPTVSTLQLTLGKQKSVQGSGAEYQNATTTMGSSAALRELQRELENKANDLSKLQKDIAKNHQVRKKYTIQLGENELVLKELGLLNEGANVYKLIGPVLVKQDLAEANANVRKRIEYISAELKRLDATVQDLEEKQNSKKEAIFKVQQRIQSLQAGKAKA